MTRILLTVCVLTLVVPTAALAQSNANLQFRLEADGMPPILFTSCRGIGSASEVIEVREGNSGAVLKTPGRTSYANVVCSRPVAFDSTLFEWRKQVEDGLPGMRKTFTLALLDRNKVMKAWKFARGWPVKWELSELDAAKNEVAIETIEIAHEGLALSP